MLEEGEKRIHGQRYVSLDDDLSRTDDLVLLAKWLDPINPLHAIPIAEAILSKIHFEWNKLRAYDDIELSLVFGLSDPYIKRLQLMLEITQRMKNEQIKQFTYLTSPSCVHELMKSYLSYLSHEEFYAIYVNNAKKLLGISCISKGGLTATLADGRVIFNKALLLCATGIILCHNHPSGVLKESKADVALTNALYEFGKLIDIAILDHVIFTDNGYISFQEEGLMS